MRDKPVGAENQSDRDQVARDVVERLLHTDANIEQNYQSILKPLIDKELECRKLREALKSLSNEADGFLGMANAQDHGHTNMRCLRDRIDEVRAVLKEGA